MKTPAAMVFLFCSVLIATVPVQAENASIQLIDNAVQKYRRQLEQDPNDIQAMLALSGLSREAGREKVSLYWLRQAWQLAPETVDIGVLLIQRYLEHRDRDRALEVAFILHQHQPNNVSAIRVLGLALLANDEDWQAVAAFRELVRYQPESAEAWHLLALSLARVEDYEFAEQAIEEALSIKDNYLPALVLHAQVMLNAGRLEEALESAHQVQDLASAQEIGHRLEAEIAMRQSNYAQAAEAYQKALDYSASTEAVLTLVRAQRLAGQDSSALDTLKAWLAVEPADARVRLQLAIYLDRLGRTEEAGVEYQRVLELDEHNIIALNNLAWLAQGDDYEQAIAYAERAAALAPQRAEIIDTLGWILLRAKRYKRSLAVLQQAHQKAPHIAPIRYHLAVALEKNGQPEQARKTLEAILVDEQEFPGKEEALELLDKLRR